MMNNFYRLALGCAFFAAAPFTSAMANVVTFEEGDERAQIECNDDNDATIDCVALTGGSLTFSGPDVSGGTAGVLDETALFYGDIYALGSNSEENEVAALNVLAGTSFVPGDATRTDGGGVSDLSFSTFAEWVVIKIGAGQLFIKNTTGGAMTLNITFEQTGSAGGISHYTEIGEIPLPAALWLMGAGIAGLGFASRRKKRAA